jgi:Flp pilus assembly protein TadG
MRNMKDESGQVLVMVALSMTVLIGFVGFATDVGHLLSQRRVAQTVADSAALAGAIEAAKEGNSTTVSGGMWTAASYDAALNGYTPGGSNGAKNASTGVTLSLYADTGVSVSNFQSPGYVQSVVSLNTSTVFMNVFGALIGNSGYSNMNVSATAIASNDITANGCVYVQNDGGYAVPAVDMGGNSLITEPTCGMTVNGNLVMGGNGTINALFVATTGTISGKNAQSNWTSGNSPESDPLSKLQDPTAQPALSGTTCTAPSGSGMTGGCVYDYGCSSKGGSCKANNCGSTCTLSGATLTANTIYYYDKGINLSGSVTGSDVTLYLTGNAYFDYDANGSGTLTPPGYGASCVGSSNPFCGVVIDAPTDGSGGAGTYSCSSGKGNNGGNPGEIYLDFGSSSTDFEGVIYAPYMQLFGQDKGASATFNADLVVGNICMQSSTFNVNGYSGPQSPLTKIGLVY